MSAPFFVEVLSRNDEVRHRHQVNALPIRIGRAYDNDFIVDDPHVAPHHALIYLTAEDGLAMRDLGTHNGIICKGVRQREMPIDGNTVFRLGQTHLRVRSADFPVSAEIPDKTIYGWEGWPPALAGLVLIALVTTFSTWLDDTEKFKALRYLTGIAGMLAVGMVWCGIWAFANRLFGGQARLGRHLFIAGCGLVTLTMWGIVSAIAAYAFSLEVFTRYGNHVEIAIAAAMIFFHLSTINAHRPRRFFITVIIVGVLGSGLTLVQNYQHQDRLADELYMHYLLPPSIRHSADESVTQFLDDAAKLRPKADEARTKSVAGGDADSED